MDSLLEVFRDLNKIGNQATKSKVPQRDKNKNYNNFLKDKGVIKRVPQSGNLSDERRSRIRSDAEEFIKHGVVGETTFSHLDRYGFIHFNTKSHSTPGKVWRQTIKLKDLPNMRSKDKLKRLRRGINGNLSVHCNCPQFLYGGYKYKAYLNGYGHRKELRYPSIRNPQLSGSVCKHLYHVIRELTEYTEVLLEAYESRGLL